MRAWKVPTCPYQTSEGTKNGSYSQNNSKSSFRRNRALSALHVISTLSFSGHEPCQNFYTMHMLPWSRNSTRHCNCKYRPLISITKSCSKILQNKRKINHQAPFLFPETSSLFWIYTSSSTHTRTQTSPYIFPFSFNLLQVIKTLRIAWWHWHAWFLHMVYIFNFSFLFYV